MANDNKDLNDFFKKYEKEEPEELKQYIEDNEKEINGNWSISDQCNYFNTTPQECNTEGKCIKSIDCGTKIYKDGDGSYLQEYNFCINSALDDKQEFPVDDHLL